MRRTGWGLALAVLCVGSMAKAQSPPLGAPEPITQLPAAAAPAPLPAATMWQPPTPAQTAHGPEAHAEAHGEEHKEFHEEHHEEEAHNAFYFDAEYLLVRPYMHGQDYAVVGTSPNFGPIGVIHSVEGDYNSGLRFAASYRCPTDNWYLQAVVTTIHNEANRTVTAPPGEAVFPTLTFPGAVTAVLGASARTTVNLNVLDLEFGKQWHPCETLGLRFFVGPRFTWIDDTFLAEYGGGAQVANDNVRRQLTLFAGGARVGGEAWWSFWESFGFYTRGSFSLLTGWFHSNLAEVADGVTVVSTSEKFHQMVPVAELGLGISYQVRWLRVSAGYEFINYFGADQGIDFADDVSPGKYNRRTGDFAFDGVVFRAELLF